MSKKRSLFVLSVFAASLLLVTPASLQAGDNSMVPPVLRMPDTEALITLLDHNAQLKELLVKSIESAKTANPDKETNPAQSLEEYYNFIDWASTAMPFNILPSAEKSPLLYERIDQSLDYFYFLIDQPLKPLTGKGYYHNSIQYEEPFRTWMIAFTKHWGDYLNTPASWNDEFYKAALADERFGLSKGWYEDPSNWHTFNQFFARHLISPDVRPIAEPINKAVVVAPADSKPQGVWQIDEKSNIVRNGVWLKSSKFNSVAQIIGPDSIYANAFANGILTHTFLDVNDYHRYHFPVDGTVVEMRTILADDAVGGVQVWDPEQKKYVLHDSAPGWQAIETRACVIVNAGKYGLVAVLPIGMSQVSSVNFEEGLEKGDTVKKGDPLGYFLFGGSDIVMIFQAEAGFQLDIKPDETGAYPHLYMGEDYGTMQGSRQ
jgi:phosphatidylserine decarboxylase precursor